MRIEAYQNQVDIWIKNYGVRYFNELTNVALLMEEVGEFASLMARKYGEQSFKKPIDDNSVKMKLEDEIGDILFVLTCLANQMEINLETILVENLEKKTARDAQRHKSNTKLMDNE